MASRCGPCEFVPHRTITQAMTAIDDVDFAATKVGANAFAVVPYYNLIEGLIQETLDLLVERDLTVLTARQIAVRFAIGGFVRKNASADLSPDQAATFAWPLSGEIPVFSHPKALAQCSGFLQRNVPEAMCCESTSTSQAVTQVAEDRFGLAVARKETLEQSGIPVLCDDIGNRQYSRCNYTEFLLAGKGGLIRLPFCETTSDLPKRTLIAIIPAVDRVGLLADILGQIAFFGINLLKIHSRPALADDFGPAPQMFYLETDVPADSPELRLCFESLEMRLAKRDVTDRGTKTGVVRLLGSYELHAVP